MVIFLIVYSQESLFSWGRLQQIFCWFQQQQQQQQIQLRSKDETKQRFCKHNTTSYRESRQTLSIYATGWNTSQGPSYLKTNLPMPRGEKGSSIFANQIAINYHLYSNCGKLKQIILRSLLCCTFCVISLCDAKR